jgi:SAM-dependent MidA family methyltransferase
MHFTDEEAVKQVKTVIGKLPEPNEEQRLLSERLVQRIKRNLHHDEGLSFARFMEQALYTPALGYYANGLEKFGADGDFITAPELSPLFGRCVGRQVSEILMRLVGGSVLELGAGSGALAEAMLLELALLDTLPKFYFILEPSASLQARQKERLLANLPQHLMQYLVWLDTLPESFVGVIVGNEVVDALPVEVVRLLPNDAQQAFVRWDDVHSRFDWDWQPIVNPSLQASVNQIRSVVGEVSSRGYITELRPVLSAWMASLSESLNVGAVLLIDYGYSRQEYLTPTRWMGSLRAHYRQRAHNDPFWFPGLQDLTAHVDFSALAEAGFLANLSLAGYTTQSNFLLSIGLLDMIDVHADVLTHLKLAQQIKTLTMPDEMGENFKVILFSKGVKGALNGFLLRDLRDNL